MSARKTVFGEKAEVRKTDAWKQLEEEHKKVNNAPIPNEGFPDMGSGTSVLICLFRISIALSMVTRRILIVIIIIVSDT